MTIDELIAREEIRRTLAAYHLAGDRARTDEFASLFTADGVLETPHSRYEGREDIRQWMRGMTQRPAAAAGTPKVTFVRHHITTCHIELTGPDKASVRTYYAVFTDSGPDHCGYY